MRPVAAILLGVLIAIGVGVGADAQAQSGSAHEVVSARRPAVPLPGLGTSLFAVSCPSANACTAVGQISNRTGGTLPLAERWNGKRWATQQTPTSGGGALYGVACGSAVACTAVGFDSKGSLAEVWNGKTWAIKPTPDPPRSADTAKLLGVSCRPASACTAVGDYEKSNGKQVALAERWNGARWTIESTPSKGSANLLNAVSCTSPTACTSVGKYFGTTSVGSLALAESWNGKGWRVEVAPSPKGSRESDLVDVSCTSTSGCTAVGSYLPYGKAELSLAETWNGKRWAIRSTPSKRDGIQLSGVSCTSPTACTAVGFYDSPQLKEESLAETWNGKRWAIRATPNPSAAGRGGTSLNGDSCSSPAACAAVGSYYKDAGDSLTLAEASTGKHWSIKSTAP